MNKVLILAANGQIARIVEEQILTEPKFKNIQLTLFLRNASRLGALASNPRVTIVEGDLNDLQAVNSVMQGQNIVFLAVVDHDGQNRPTANVIQAMQQNHVERVIAVNVLGIYDEVTGEFGRWNQASIGTGLVTARHADQLLADSDLAYTTLRLPWLNDRDEVKYTITTRNESYLGVSGSRKSIAALVLALIADPNRYQRESLGIADPATQGKKRPVY